MTQQSPTDDGRELYKRETLTNCTLCPEQIVRAIDTDNWNHVEDDGMGTLTYVKVNPKHYGQPHPSGRSRGADRSKP